jgi:hypothetical protein
VTTRLERSSALPAANALPRLAHWFLRHGYEQVAKSAGELSLFHAGAPSHRLSICSDGKTVTFEFGLDGDTTDLERRVDAAMAGLTGVPTAAASGRCPACSTTAEPGAKECAVCGSSLA